MNWPAKTLAEVDAEICAPGALYEMETVSIRGVPTRVWKNQPPDLAAFLRRARALHGASELVVYNDERVTYEGLFRAAAAIAPALQAARIGKGDRVAIAMRNYPEWIAAFFGITTIGAIVVPLNAWWTGGELAYALEDSGTALLIADMARCEAIRPHFEALPALREVWVTRAGGAGIGGPVRALEDVIGTPGNYLSLPDADLPAVAIDPDDDATIFYTSGTTGHPKGALGTHRNIMTCAMTAGYSGQRIAVRAGEPPVPPSPRVALLTIPLFHATGCHAWLMNTMYAGGKLVLMHSGVGEAMGGWRAIVGEPDRAPSRVGVSIGDTLAATYGCLGALAALHARESTGCGQVIDAALYESVLQVMESLIPEYDVSGIVRGRHGAILPGIAPSNVYKCADGEYMIAANGDAIFARLAVAMGQPDLASDLRYATHGARGERQAELDGIVEAWTKTLPVDRVEALMIEHSVPAGRVYRAPDMLADPHFAAREAITSIDHPVHGRVRMQNAFPKLSDTPSSIRRAAPRKPGSDNAEIYGGRLAMGAAEMDALKASGVI